MLLCAALLGACTPSVEEAGPGPVTTPPNVGGSLEIGVLGEPETLDPYAPEASDLTYALVRPVFPMPYQMRPDGSVGPELASSLDVRGRTARLTLDRREWSNGKPITARDVVASIERATPPSGFAAIESARARGPRVVEMRADLSDWEKTLARGAFVLPRGRLIGGNVSGSSFKFATYDRGRSLTYEPNDAAVEPPLLDELKVTFVQSTDLLVRLLDEGELDVAAVPMSVNLDDRLDELGISYEDPVGSERVVLSFHPDRVPSTSARALVDKIDARNLVESFVRDDGELLAPPGATGEAAPQELSIAAPEGDELLTLLQRALQLDLQRSGITVELITAPVSTIYGSWSLDPSADVLLLRSLTDDETDGFRWPLASVATTVAWRDGVHGISVNPSLEGPLWNARDWWIEPSI